MICIGTRFFQTNESRDDGGDLFDAARRFVVSMQEKIQNTSAGYSRISKSLVKWIWLGGLSCVWARW